jgi:hypothetical protein
MRRRCDPIVIPDPSRRSGGHSAGEQQGIPSSRGLVVSDVPELWRKHARQPWKVIFPNLDWPLPDDDA